jgi:PAS domain S-box-containing protein
MANEEPTVPAERVALIARALRSLDIAELIQPPARRIAPRPARAASRSLRSALRTLFAAESAAGSNRRLKQVLGRLSEAMLEGIALFGRDGGILYANDGVCQMLGCAREELIGKRAQPYFGDIGARARRCTRRARNVRPDERYEVELRTKAGRPLVVEVCSARIEASDGTLLGVLSVMLDITARANALRHSESEMRLLSAQLVAAQELERQRIARELHDSVGQALGGMKFGLESCEAQLGAGKDVTRTLRQLAGSMQGVIDEVRRISMNLRPSTLDDLGILPTLGWFMREFSAIYGQIELNTLVDVEEEEIAAPLKTAIYRIVQEAFNNVVTHSGARRVSLVLRRRERKLELQVQDDGAGFDATPRGKGRSGLGLATMRERAEVTGGRFSLRSAAGTGSTVAVSWPLYQGKRKCPKP